MQNLTAATMSYLYMAPCPPPFVATNEFQQHAYSRNLSTDIVLALMIICHIPPDPSTTDSTTSYRQTSTLDVETTTSSTPLNHPTSISEEKTTTTQSNIPTSISDVETTFTRVITSTEKNAPSENLLILIVVPIVVFIAAFAVCPAIIRHSLPKWKKSTSSTHDITDAYDGDLPAKSEQSKTNNKENPGKYRRSADTIYNVSRNVPIETRL